MSHRKTVMAPAAGPHRLFALPADPDVAVLLGDPRPLVRRAGIDLARELMRRWRAAPALLTPLITAHLSGGEAEVPLLESLDDAAAVPALVRITGDRAYADAYLGALPDDPPEAGPELLGLLMDRGGPTGRQAGLLHRASATHAAIS